MSSVTSLQIKTIKKFCMITVPLAFYLETIQLGEVLRGPPSND